MIKKLTLNNFLSHKNTCLTFEPGITVFVGHNGSGKSSIIDAITFALFNEHTRKSNKNLITKGIDTSLPEESGSFVIMDFSIGSVEYKIQRQINNAGQLVSVKLGKLEQNNNFDKTIQEPRLSYKHIISGERKQLEESVVKEIKSMLEIDYQKLQIASIIQQGEINKIIDSQPKEFKELLNNLIGLYRLDVSYIYMHYAIDEFRKSLREKTGGYDDNHIHMLITKIEENKNKLLVSEKNLDKINNDLSKVTNQIESIEKEIEDLEPKVAKILEMKSLEGALLKYLKEKSVSLINDIKKEKRKSSEVKNAFTILKDKDEIAITLQMVQSEKDDLNNKLHRLEGEIGKLTGFTECAKKIQIIDGKCPVCNSKISVINNMFDIFHIKKELDKKNKEKKLVVLESLKLNQEEISLRKKEKDIISAEELLLSYKIFSDNDLSLIQKNLLNLDKDYQILSKLNFASFSDTDTDLLLYRLDEYSTNLIDDIIDIKKNTVNINTDTLKQKKILKNKLLSEFVNIKNQKAILEKNLMDVNHDLVNFEKLLAELYSASGFISDLEKIRSLVFNRDGMVSSSLRTMALNLISVKSSEYVNTFNVGISRISLVEKPREIKILCYGKRGEIDIFSLSGGEKVAVSLALRMAIAFLMGSSKIDFIILDEPTSNLDEERRHSFVKIISDVFSKGIGPLSQIIIITHDEEIFENSEIEQIYKFSMTDKGSIVTPL
jgi:exonuclease SbcC